MSEQNASAGGAGRGASSHPAKSSAHILERLVASAPVSFAMFDREMRYLAASQCWLRECGIPQENVIGRSHYEVLPHLSDEWTQAHRRGLAGETLQGEGTWTAQDGRRHAVRWVIQPWMDGEQVGGIIIFIEDVSSRLEAEARLRGSEERWKTTLSSIGDAVLTCDTMGRVTFLNRSAEVLTGWPLAEATGRTVQEVFQIINEDDGHPAEDIFARVLETRGTVELANHSALIARDGRHVPIEDSAAPIFSEGGELTGIVLVFHDVTARRAARELLERNVALLNETGELAKVGGWEFDPATGEGQWTDETARIHDLEPGAPICASKGMSYYAPEARPIIAEAVRAAIEEGKPYDLELPLISEKGIHKWVRTIGHAEVRNGTTVRVYGVLQDVTEQKRAASALAASQRAFREMFQNIPIGVYRTTPDGHVLMANPALCRMLGCKDFAELEQLEREVGGVFEPMFDREGFRRELESHGELIGYEAVWLRRDGTSLYVREAAKVVRDEQGKPLYYEGTVEDITQRKHAEERVRASEAKLRSYLDNAPFAILVTDRDTRIVDCNPEAYRMLGYDRANRELLGLDVSQLHPPEGISAWQERRARLRQYGCVEDEFRALRKDGSQIWASLSAVALEKGFNLSFITDITEARTAKQQIQDLEEQFRQAQKMEAIGRLAGGIAHDFNNLLMVIMSQADVLGSAVQGELAERAESISKAAERAAEMTSQLLAFSRKQTLKPVVTTLAEVVQGFSKMLGRLVGEDVTVALELGAEHWPVRVDRSQMEQVLMNLVVNARDAMPRGGRVTIETGQCEIREEDRTRVPGVPPGHYAFLRVSDTGCGMSSQVMAHLFEPFFTTKQPGKGTGLGLAMIYGIVKQSGGHVWVESREGAGSTFSLYFPKAAPDVVAAAAPRRYNADPPERRSGRVLLVEDEEYLRSLIAEFLRRAGYEVLEAEGQLQARSLVAEHDGDIQLLLTDVVLKDGNGRDLAQLLAAQGSHFPVLFMSGYTPDSIVHHGVLEPGTHLIQKPFSREELYRRVDEILADHVAGQGI